MLMGSPRFPALDRCRARPHLTAEDHREGDLTAAEAVTAFRGDRFLYQWRAGVRFQRVSDPWDGHARLLGQPRFLWLPIARRWRQPLPAGRLPAGSMAAPGTTAPSPAAHRWLSIAGHTLPLSSAHPGAALTVSAPICLLLSGRALARAALGWEFPISTLSIVERVPRPTMTHVSSRPPSNSVRWVFPSTASSSGISQCGLPPSATVSALQSDP
jgi:hypothetical protein